MKFRHYYCSYLRIYREWKILSYFVPLVSVLSGVLFSRQLIRIKAEEDIGDDVDDLLNRVAATTSKTEIETHAMDENYDDNANTLLKQLRLNLDPGFTHI